MSYTGTVNQSRLRIRIGGPSKDFDAEDRLLHRGENVTILRAVIGQRIRQQNIWFELPDNRFVWSGRIDPSVPVSQLMEKRNVIFTADDYGAVDSIDDGVIYAVKKGKLRSVACFTNYRRNDTNISLKKARELQQVDATVELGVHLTISSGDPLLPPSQVSLICNPAAGAGSKFRPYTEVLEHYESLSVNNKKEYRKQLANEIKAQLNVFNVPDDNKSPIRIAHITSHHNTLLFHPDFFDTLTAVVQEYSFYGYDQNKKPAFRSLENLPNWKDYLYLYFKGGVKCPVINKSRLKNIASLKGIRMMDLLHSSHYGPLPSILISEKGQFKDYVNQKIFRANKMMRDLNLSGKQGMEVLLHLRAGGLKTSHQDYLNEINQYSGVDHRSFDARYAELVSFISFCKDPEIMDQVEIGSWSELFNY